MVFPFGGNAQLDASLNYTFGCLMILFFLISTILNPLLFYSYSTKKQQTIQNFLFKVIAVSDFLTNFVPTIFMAYVFLSTVELRHNLLNQLPDFISCTFGCISQVTTTMMAVTRMISVMRPFFRVKFRRVIAYLVFYAVYMCIGNGGSLISVGIEVGRMRAEDTHNHTLSHNLSHNSSDIHNETNKDRGAATLAKINTFVCFLMNVIHCTLGILCSFITVLHLRFNMFRNAERDRKLKSSATILVMNIPYVISVVTNILAYYKFLGIDFQMVNHYFIPTLTSAFNPCVIALRTNAVKAAVAGGSVRRGSIYIGCSSRLTDAKTIVVMENPTIGPEEGVLSGGNFLYDQVELVSMDRNIRSPDKK